MKTSCGFIIKDKNTGLFLGCLPTGRKKRDTDCCDIPKGCIEDTDNGYLSVAIRELKEETGIEFMDLDNIKKLGLVDYLKDKNLYLFYAETDIDLKKLKCTSTFVDANGKNVPEMSTFMLGDLSIFRPKMREAIIKVLKI